MRWYPFGPLSKYRQRQRIWHGMYAYYPDVTFTRNLAYRLTQLKVATTYPDNHVQIDYAEDVRGRFGA